VRVIRQTDRLALILYLVLLHLSEVVAEITNQGVLRAVQAVGVATTLQPELPEQLAKAIRVVGV
jgi:hypothetical protein